jgi:hypothetical protein
MSKSKIVLIAAFAGMSIAFPAFGQSQDQYGSVLPNHLEGEKTVWGSWYAHDLADNQGPEGTRSHPRGRSAPKQADRP